MIDSVVVPAIGSGYDEPRQLFTIDMQLRYLAPIGEEDAIAEGWIVRRGRQIVFCDAEVRAESGELAATGHARLQGFVALAGDLTHHHPHVRPGEP